MRLRTPAVCAVVAIFLAACGGQDGSDGTGQATAGEAQTRTVEHAMGTTEVPADVEDVVVLDTGELDAVVSLGVIPVGA